jgi:hypothetical protein
MTKFLTVLQRTADDCVKILISDIHATVMFIIEYRKSRSLYVQVQCVILQKVLPAVLCTRLVWCLFSAASCVLLQCQVTTNGPLEHSNTESRTFTIA